MVGFVALPPPAPPAYEDRRPAYSSSVTWQPLSALPGRWALKSLPLSPQPPMRPAGPYQLDSDD